MSSAFRSSRSRDTLLAALVLMLAWCVLFAPQLFERRIFTLGDARVYRPFSEFSRVRWAASHQRTFWNPFVFAGLPAAASLADSRPQYLPDAMLDAVEALRRMPGWPPLALPLIAHLIGMLAVAALVRRLWCAGAAGMVVGGLSWGLMPNLLVPFAYGHDAQLVSASLMPLVLLMVHCLFETPDSEVAAAAVLGLALVLGLQCLLGHPQLVVYSGMLAALFSLERAAHFRRPGRLVALAAAALLGALLSAAVWRPALLYGAFSERSGGMLASMELQEMAKFSLAPRDLLALVWPWAMGHAGPTYWGGMGGTDYPQYFGVTVSALAVIACWRRGPSQGSAGLFALVAAASLLLSLGTHLSAAFEFLRAHIPLWSTFRVPVAVLIVAQLGISLLAARALALSWTHAWSTRSRLGAAAFVLAIVAALGAGVAIWGGPWAAGYAGALVRHRSSVMPFEAFAVARRAGMDLALRSCLVATLAALLLIFGRRAKWAPVAASAIALLIAIDLGGVSLPLIRASDGVELALVPPPSPLARLAGGANRYRVMSLPWPEFYSNDCVSWRVRAVGGCHGSFPRPWYEALNWGVFQNYAVVRALAVGWIESESTAVLDSAFCVPVGPALGPIRVWRVRHPLPRAYTVARVQAAGNDVAVLDALLSPRFVADSLAVTGDDRAAGEYPGSRSASILWLEDEPDRLALETRAPDRSFLVVADAWFPGWSACLDQRPVTIVRVDHLLRGIALPPGAHRVTMEYRPEGWGPAVFATRGAFLMSLALAGALMIRRGRRNFRSPGRA